MIRFKSRSTNSVVDVREKFSSELTISLARKVCLAIFSSSLRFLVVARDLLGQHLRIGRNDR